MFNSTISIGVFVLPATVMNGMEPGFVATIFIVILIGCSVDYVVHLGNHYLECYKKKRKERTDEALKYTGLSIYSGALANLGLLGRPAYCVSRRPHRLEGVAGNLRRQADVLGSKRVLCVQPLCFSDLLTCRSDILFKRRTEP